MKRDVVSAAVDGISSEADSIGVPIVPVKLCSSTGELVTTYAFLDGGSNSSFCSQILKNQLNIKSTKHKL